VPILFDNEVLIKSKKRVQQHGEVFTPKEIVDAMVCLPGLDEAILQPQTTVLEPAVGEGAFLVNILQRRLRLIAQRFKEDITRFEHFALLALTSLYGIELLEDNTKKCVMNLYEVFLDVYKQACQDHLCLPKDKVKRSAQTIISANVVQGDFLKRVQSDGKPIILSEWRPSRITKRTKNIILTRTEYSLNEVYDQQQKEDGEIYSSSKITKQLHFDDVSSIAQSRLNEFRYVPVHITDVFKQETEEVS
jgi:hypothetical protein